MNSRIRKYLIVILLCGMIYGDQEASEKHNLRTENLLLITIDGFRWQELFFGADSSLINNREFVEDIDALKASFWRETAAERRQALMPFFWDHFGSRGQIYGNPDLNSPVYVSNKIGYSYPGYSEILVGFADERISGNDKIWNPNKSFLEFINEQPGFRGRVAVFGSWETFEYIVNTQRSGIYVNAGFEQAVGPDLTPREEFLNELITAIPRRWAGVRFDAFTHYYALEHFRKKRPRVMYIAYGETDDFAHDGRYDTYLRSARQTDRFIKQLFEFIQSSPFYRAKTTILITSDHGRGSEPIEAWQSHNLRPGKLIAGSDRVWLAAWGPDTNAMGEMEDTERITVSQIARTAAYFLGFDYKNERPVGQIISGIIAGEQN